MREHSEISFMDRLRLVARGGELAEFQTARVRDPGADDIWQITPGEAAAYVEAWDAFVAAWDSKRTVPPGDRGRHEGLHQAAAQLSRTIVECCAEGALRAQALASLRSAEAHAHAALFLAAVGAR